MANYTKINLDLQSDLVLSNAKIDAVTGGLRTELDGIILSGSTAVAAEETRALAAEVSLGDRIDTLEDDFNNDLGVEVARAEAAELVLTNALDAEISATDADFVTTNAAIYAEETRAMGVEADLESSINNLSIDTNAAISAEETRAMGVEAGLQSSINNLSIDSQNYTNAAVLVEKDRAEAAELELSNQISDIISNVDPSALDSLSEIVAAFQGADGDLSAAITSALGTHTSELATEIADRIAGDAATLAAAKVYTDALENGKVAANTAAIDAEVIRAKAAEVVNANNIVSGDAATLVSGKTYADGKVATEKAERIADVNAEQTRAEGAEASLGMDIANETERAIAAESGLQSSINTLTVDAQDYADAAVLVEKDRAEAAEVVLADRVSVNENDIAEIENAAYNLTNELADEKARAIAEEGVLAGEILTEKERAEAAEAAISNDLDVEVTRALAAELVLTNELADEKARAIAEEGVLAGEISDEISRATAAELVLTNDLATEVTRATAAEGVLDGKIGTEKGRIDAILLASDADKDSFAEIVTLINSVDLTNDNALGTAVTNINNAVAAEVIRAEAAELVLSAEISDEKARALAAEGVLASDIVAEETRALDAEQKLSVKLSDEVTRAKAAELVLTNDLATEVTRATAAEGVLQNNIDGVAGDLSNLDGVVSAQGDRLTTVEGVASDNGVAISNEVVRAMAAEGVNAAAISAEETRAMGVEAGLQSSINNLVTDSQNYTDNAVSGLRGDVDTAMEAMGAIDFSTIFAQKIGGKTNDNVTYVLTTLDFVDELPVMGTSLQVFENGLLLEAGTDYDVVSANGLNNAKAVQFKYEIKSDWKVAFFGVPFKASVSDLVA